MRKIKLISLGVALALLAFPVQAQTPVVPGTLLAPAAKGQQQQFQMWPVDASGYLKVDVAAGGGSGGTSQKDQSAFTQGATAITPIGCLYISSYAAITTGEAGVASCTSGGALNVNVVSGGGGGITQATTGSTSGTTLSGSYTFGLVQAGFPSESTYANNTIQPLTIDPDGDLHVEQPDWTGTATLSTASVATVSSTGATITTSTSTWAIGQAVAFTGTLGTTLAAGQIYCIVATNTTTTMQVSATCGGTAITPSISLTSAAVWNAYIITPSDGQSTMAVQFIYSGGAATLNPVVSANGTQWIVSNVLLPASGTLASTFSASNAGKMSVSGWLNVGFFVNGTSSANTITIGWKSGANTTTVGLTSPLPNGGNTIGNVNPGTAANWGIVAQGASITGAVGTLLQGSVTTSAPSYTTAQISPLSLDTAGNLRVNVVTGGGSGGTSLADQAAFTQTSTAITPIGCLYIGSYASITTGHAGVVSCTAAGSMHTTVDNVNSNITPGDTISTATYAGASPTIGVALLWNGTTYDRQKSVSTGVASVGVASGGIASGAIASGAVASGAIASGAIASGAVASGAFASGAFAAGSFVNATAGDPCMFAGKKTASFSTGTSGTQLIAGTGSTNTYICSLAVIASAAANFSLVVGSGSSVCTGGTPLAIYGGTTTASAGMSLAANGGLTAGNGGGTIASDLAAAAQGYNVCIGINGTSTLAGTITYIQR